MILDYSFLVVVMVVVVMVCMSLRLWQGGGFSRV